jgi:hypothetical protein
LNGGPNILEPKLEAVEEKIDLGASLDKVPAVYEPASSHLAVLSCRVIS